MKHREIAGLEWARLAPCPWPQMAKPKGSKAQGLAYERAIAREIPKAKRNLWVRFKDANGEGYCCPDFVLKLGGKIVILEAKLTDCQDAYTQLSRLYLPVFKWILQTDEIEGVVVAKNLHKKSYAPASDIPGALRGSGLVHWIGKTPLIP